MLYLCCYICDVVSTSYAVDHCICVVGVSQSNATKITSLGKIFNPQHIDGNTWTAHHLPSSENHLLNSFSKKCVVNTSEIHCVPTDVEQSGNSRIFDDLTHVSNPRCVNGKLWTAHTLQDGPTSVPQADNSLIVEELSGVSS